jgi:hypothetical protein
LYLDETGWRRQDELWRGGAVWLHADDHEIIVPPTDSLGDSDRRKHDILRLLARLEERPTQEIATDIDASMVDTLSCHTYPDDLPSGYARLRDGSDALQGLVGILESVLRKARTLLGGGRLLDHARLGPARAGSYVFTAHLPLTEAPQARPMLAMLYESVTAAQDAVQARSIDALAAGQDRPELYESLSKLSGRTHQAPFGLGFRWARGVRSELPARTVEFGPGSGELLRKAAQRLRRPDSGERTAEGVIEVLADRPGSDDRYRIRVHPAGERAFWVRLTGQAEYDAAILAHTGRLPVRVRYSLRTDPGRTGFPLLPGGFDVLA